MNPSCWKEFIHITFCLYCNFPFKLIKEMLMETNAKHWLGAFWVWKIEYYLKISVVIIIIIIMRKYKKIITEY